MTVKKNTQYLKILSNYFKYFLFANNKINDNEVARQLTIFLFLSTIKFEKRKLDMRM